MENNVIDITLQINEKIKLDNNIRIYQKQIDRLADIGKAILQQPLEHFSNPVFSNEEMRSSCFNWSVEFRLGIDRDYESLDYLISVAEKTLENSLKHSKPLLKL